MATAQAYAARATAPPYWFGNRPKAVPPRRNMDTRALAGAVYGELRALANRLLHTEDSNHLFQPTALVHEAYARLMQDERGWNDQAHFLATAARTMRRILVDQARRTRAMKRGSGEQHIQHNEELHSPGNAPCLVALDEALTELNEMDARQGLVVELRFFGGLSIDECAVILDVSKRTVSNDWQMAKAWLYGRLKMDML